MLTAIEMLHRAVARHQTGNHAGASELYRAALAVQPDLADAARLLSVIDRQSGNARRGWLWASRALLLAPTDPGAAEALKNAAVALIKALEREGAAASERSLDAHDVLTVLISDNAAISANRQAIIQHLLTRAMDYHRRGDLGEAERLYRRVLRSIPGDADVLFLLAQVERRRGDAVSAISTLTRAMVGRVDISRRELLSEIVVEALARDRAAPNPVEAVNRTLAALFDTSATPARQPAFLTIAIPTWNRCDRLARCLAALIEQIELLGRQDVRILVSDNGSNDGTPEMLRALALRHPFVISHPNAANLGFEWNVFKLAWLTAWAQPSTFTWLHGDDDETQPGGVALIVETLERTPADYLTFSSQLCRAAALRPAAEIRGRKVWRGPMMAMCEEMGLVAVLGAVSRVVFRAERLQAAQWERHLNSFAHATMLLDALFDADVCVVDADLQFANSDGAETAARWMQEGAYVRLLRVADAVTSILADHRPGGVVREGFWSGTTRGYLGETLHVVESLIDDIWNNHLTPERRRLLGEGYLPRIKALLGMTAPGAVKTTAQERYEALRRRVASPQS